MDGERIGRDVDRGLAPGLICWRVGLQRNGLIWQPIIVARTADEARDRAIRCIEVGFDGKTEAYRGSILYGTAIALHSTTLHLTQGPVDPTGILARRIERSRAGLPRSGLDRLLNPF
jgi:hypothetical protein